MKKHSISFSPNSSNSYRENELEYLMTKSTCFLLVQSYQENQTKITDLKTELKKYDFSLQKLPIISLSLADNVFIKNSD
jgi:hypothetical protein